MIWPIKITEKKTNTMIMIPTKPIPIAVYFSFDCCRLRLYLTIKNVKFDDLN